MQTTSTSPAGAGPGRTPIGGARGRRWDRRGGASGAVLALTGSLFLCLSLELALGTLHRPGPGLWPVVLSAVLIATSGLLLFVTDQAADQERWTRRSGLVAVGVGALALFITLFGLLGFGVPGTLLLLFWLRVFAREPWRVAVPVAVGAVLAIEVVFVHLIGVPFPADIFATLTVGGGA